MKFNLIKKKNKGRIGRIETGHGMIETPVFMSVGTAGTVKAMRPEDLKRIGAQIILGNTYHLFLKPGVEILRKFGGLHKFMNWDGPILTDSGGYQIFSLGKKFGNQTQNVKGKTQNHSEKLKTEEVTGSLVKITEEGAVFKSHIDGSRHLFTPEKVIDIQLAIGSDIMMPLDYCPSAEAGERGIEWAVKQTNRWFERTWKYFEKVTKDTKIGDRPGLFAIVQGGADQKLRKKSFEYLSQFPVDGFSIGGVANAGESKDKQRRALEYTLPLLPEDKPRYLMGVGEIDDMAEAIKRGVDMFDCVLPTRLARHGVAWIINDEKSHFAPSVSLPDFLLGASPAGRSPAENQERCTTLYSAQNKISHRWYGKLDFRKSMYKDDQKPIMEDCDCATCQSYSRAYIHHLIKSKEILGIILLTEHNLRLVMKVFEDSRNGNI